MKYCVCVLILAVLAFADNDGCIGISSGASSGSASSDGITLTMVNDWVLTGRAFGLDVFEGAGDVFILGSDKERVYAYDAYTGVIQDSLILDVTNTKCFGVAWNNDYTNDTYYTDDWGNSNLFCTDDFGSTWTTQLNPAEKGARGMDFDGTDYWTTHYFVSIDFGLWCFLPGVSEQYIATPEFSSMLSGVTVFPLGGNLCIAVAAYVTNNIIFYDWDGSTLTFIGEAAYPATSIYRSYGLAYSDTIGNIFWSWLDYADNYHLSELSFELLALDQASWGAIKSSF